jgi:hypothetical protein
VQAYGEDLQTTLVVLHGWMDARDLTQDPGAVAPPEGRGYRCTRMVLAEDDTFTRLTGSILNTGGSCSAAFTALAFDHRGMRLSAQPFGVSDFRQGVASEFEVLFPVPRARIALATVRPKWGMNRLYR